MNSNIRLAAIFLLSLTIWFASGLISSSQPTQNSVAAKIPTGVQITTFKKELFNPILSLRANTQPNRTVSLAAQIVGKVSAVLVDEGAAVIKGQVICEISEEDRYFRLDQAKAHFEQSSIAYRGAITLKNGGFQSEVAIAQAKATLETAKANLKRAQLDIGHLKIVAPFDGIIETRALDIGDYVVPGTICALLVDLDPIKVTALVNEYEVGKVKMASVASASIGLNEPVEAVVSYIAHQANHTTQSYRVEALVKNSNKSIRAGLSTRLEIPTEGVEAHLIPASSILLNDQGGMAVRIIVVGNIAQSISVVVLGEIGAGIWVSGLPELVNVITVGQNYVIDGEVVEPTFLNSTTKI